jgi:hypothetical protein
MSRPIKTHTFAGQRFAVTDQTGLQPPVLAECDYDGRIIRIPVDGDTLSESDWIIHESLHACCPYLAEDAVDKTATSIARLLWRLGWRKE